ncbi:MAG: hypothetical protein E3J56_04145 [Candidatus Aminicenantes bacterium]|nr:MAG: hypothetical protein E3J56_04145 [Candidatus Aminicenantes bacterium]
MKSLPKPLYFYNLISWESTKSRPNETGNFPQKSVPSIMPCSPTEKPSESSKPNLPDPDVLALEIAENLESALDQFRAIYEDLEEKQKK